MTDLLKPLEVLSEESHGSFRPVSAQLHNAVLQQLLDVVLLHVALTFPQAPLFFTARTAGRHDDLLTQHMQLTSAHETQRIWSKSNPSSWAKNIIRPTLCIEIWRSDSRHAFYSVMLKVFFTNFIVKSAWIWSCNRLCDVFPNGMGYWGRGHLKHAADMRQTDVIREGTSFQRRSKLSYVD